MKKEILDLSPLKKALNQLKKSLSYYHSDMAQKDHDLQMQFVSATIQAFEFTYELSSKFLRRYLKISEPSSAIIEEMSFPNLIRTASTKGLLLNDWATWTHYRDKRNTTSQTYDEEKANDVIETVPAFVEEISYFLNELETRITSA